MGKKPVSTRLVLIALGVECAFYFVTDAVLTHYSVPEPARGYWFVGLMLGFFGALVGFAFLLERIAKGEG